MPAHGTLVDHDHGVAFMQSLYTGLLQHAAIEIGELFRALAAADGTPTVFHCTAGKDRTGVVAALLLLWLGVDREDVLDDFELTDRYVTREHHEALFQRMLERGMGPEAAAGMLAAPRASMAAALDLLDATYGGIEAYLRGPAGVDDAGARPRARAPARLTRRGTRRTQPADVSSIGNRRGRADRDRAASTAPARSDRREPRRCRAEQERPSGVGRDPIGHHRQDRRRRDPTGARPGVP